MPLAEADILQVLMQARSRLSAAVWLVVRDPHAAEDIFQNLAVKAMTGRASFPTEAALLSWAFITGRREGIDWLRRQQRESTGLADDVLELLEREWQEPDRTAGARLEALGECLESLPEAARRMLRLRYFEGRSCEEVADQMSLGLDAVYKRLSRLHQALRQCVEGRLGNRAGNPA
ncbi:MAG: RNA polymerase sigma factor [Verrucomicrobiota bacterium]